MKGYISSKLIFPIIITTKEGTTTFYTNESPLIKIRKRTFDSHFLEGTILIDSLGVKYKIAHVKNLGYVNFLWGLNPFLERMINVCIDLQKVESLSVEKFRSVALKIIKSNSDYYISSGRNLKEIISIINGAVNTEEITNALVGDSD